jgi:cellulose synthase operon protein B
MLSILARLCRVPAAGLLLALMAWPWAALAQAALAQAALAQTALRGQPPLDRPSVAVLLGERGWPDGVQLQGHFDRQTVHLPTLNALGPTHGSLRLVFDSRLPGYRVASLQIRLNDRAVEAIDLLARPGGRLELPLSAGDLARPFTKIEAVLRGSIADDRCVDERIAGGFVTLQPSSGLHLAPGPELGPDVWRTIATLPRRVEIGFAGDPADPAIFAASLTTAAALARAGHVPVFRGTGANAGAIQAGDGLYDLVRLEADSPPPDVMIGKPALIRHALAAIGPDRAGRVMPADYRIDRDDQIVALPMGSRTVLAITPAAAPGLATLSSSGMTPLAAGLTTTAQPTGAAGTMAPGVLRLSELAADLGPRALVDQAEWRVAVPVTNLPIGHVARHAVLDLMIPPGLDSESASEPLLARAVVDGELVGAWRLAADPEPVRLRVPLDRAGTRLVSDVRLQLQRQPGSIACRTQPVPVEVELLPTSHLELASVSGAPRNFAEFAARLGETVEIQFEPGLLGRPATLLATLTPIVEQLVRGGARRSVNAAGGATASPGSAILVGRSFAAALTAPLSLAGTSVAVAGPGGAELVEVGPADSLAVLQLAQHGGNPVLWLAGTGPDLPAWRPARLDRENVVIGDAIGTRIGFDQKADRAISIDHRPAESWAERLGGASAALLAAGWLGLTLVAVVIARLRGRRRTQSAA